MSRTANGRVASSGHARLEVAGALRLWRAGIEDAIVARIRDVASDAAGSSGMPSEDGRAVVVAVLDYALTLFDGVIASINEEYGVQRVAGSPEQRRVERVRRLLAGEPADAGGPAYALDRWHLGIIGNGLGVGQALRAAVAGLDCELLCVSPDERSAWAWLGGRRNAVADATERLKSARWPAGMKLAVGELRNGPDGWRWTHHEAQAALTVARRKQQGFTRCADVVLEAALLRDDVLARTLRDVYLSPLDDLRIGGAAARETLRAYFTTGRNVSKAADRLAVDRRTVWHRLDKIAAGLGWQLAVRSTELEVALRLEMLEDEVRETGQANS